MHRHLASSPPVRRPAATDVPALPSAPPREDVLTIDAVRIATELRALLAVSMPVDPFAARIVR